MEEITREAYRIRMAVHHSDDKAGLAVIVNLHKL